MNPNYWRQRIRSWLLKYPPLYSFVVTLILAIIRVYFFLKSSFPKSKLLIRYLYVKSRPHVRTKIINAKSRLSRDQRGTVIVLDPSCIVPYGHHPTLNLLISEYCAHIGQPIRVLVNEFCGRSVRQIFQGEPVLSFIS